MRRKKKATVKSTNKIPAPKPKSSAVLAKPKPPDGKGGAWWSFKDPTPTPATNKAPASSIQSAVESFLNDVPAPSCETLMTPSPTLDLRLEQSIPETKPKKPRTKRRGRNRYQLLINVTPEQLRQFEWLQNRFDKPMNATVWDCVREKFEDEWRLQKQMGHDPNRFWPKDDPKEDMPV